MNTYIIIARILGITFTVMGLSLFTNKKGTIAFVNEVVKDKAMMWILGLFALTMGAIMVVFNNVWSSGLELFITVVGWLTLVKGAVILLFPDSSASYYKKVNKESIFMTAGLIVFIFGLALLYSGFM